MKLSALCARYLAECGKGLRPVLSRVQDDPIAKKNAAQLTAADFIAHCRLRRQYCVPATVLKDIIALRGVLSYAKPGWGMQNVTDAPIREAWPILKKEGLVGGSRRRTREPSNPERSAVVSYFKERCQTLYADIAEFQDYSSRRISETCRLWWGDLNVENKTILVRDMKHPTRKDGNHKEVALPDEAFAVIMRQPRRTTLPDERIFPVGVETAKAAFRRAFKAIKVYKDLHLHDYRRGTVTRLLAEGRSVPEIMLVTGHETAGMVLTVYNALKAEDFHKRRAA